MTLLLRTFGIARTDTMIPEGQTGFDGRPAESKGESMAKKLRFDGVIVKRDVDASGFVYAYDANDRACWSATERERVMLMHDLRKYGKELHIGQLGWTVVGTTDGYKWVDVFFDCGVQLPVLTYGLQRVVSEQAIEIAQRELVKNRGTRFDADAAVAEIRYQEWLKQEFATWINSDELLQSGDGPQELYAFTFPSLRALAQVSGKKHFPMKIGYSGNQDAGAFYRVRGQIGEVAALPERPLLLIIWRTWNGRALEKPIHDELRQRNRATPATLGREWFDTCRDELTELCNHFGSKIERPPARPVSGASPGISDVVEAGGTVEYLRSPKSASVGIRIVPPADLDTPPR